MEKLRCDNFLEFNPNQLEEVRKSLGYNDANAVSDAMHALEEWISKQHHFLVKKFDRNYLECLLVSAKGSIEKTKGRLDRICTAKHLLPELFLNINIDEEFRDMFHDITQCVLPKPTADNYRVLLSKLEGDKYEHFNTLSFIRYFDVMAEYLFSYDYVLGVEWIFDCRKINFNFLTKLNPHAIQKGTSVFFKSYSIRTKAIYLISSSKLVETLASVLKAGMPEKIAKRLHVLSSPELLLNYYPEDMLPSDYGGKEKSAHELRDNLFEELNTPAHQELMRKMEAAATDENCRNASRYNEEILGMPGSFKKLTVD